MSEAHVAGIVVSPIAMQCPQLNNGASCASMGCTVMMITIEGLPGFHARFGVGHAGQRSVAGTDPAVAPSDW